MFIQLLLSLLFSIIAAMLAPKPKPPKPASLEDFDVPQTTEGSVQIWIFGDCWIPDWFVLGQGNFKTKAIKSDGDKK